MIILRPFQNDLKQGLYAAWNAGATNVILVSPTGSGKTVTMSAIASDVQAPACAIAHRQELVQQISLAMARMGLKHNIVAPSKIVSVIISQHISELGCSFYDRSAHLTVAGVNTLNSRADELRQWANTIQYWFGDECHHFLSDNQWGRAVDMFPNAKGVGFTATPLRCDRKSLWSGQKGVFDDMVLGPTMRELIGQGFLADYRIFGPPQSIDTREIKVSKATGDFSAPSLRSAANESTITGDIVEHYLKIAEGKRGITFTVDVYNAVKTAQAFRDAGVSAEAISAKTPDTIRNEMIRKFREGKILQLVNVDLFGEGFDVPAVEVVSMGRPTKSLGLYMQQFGRALRALEGKTHGIVIDHVGNVKQHGLPDSHRAWSLVADERGKRGAVSDDVVPVTTCTKCFMAYERVTKACPHCGHVEEPQSRTAPEFVDGDLIEFDEALLSRLRGEIAKVDADKPPIPYNLQDNKPAVMRIVKRHGERQQAQQNLRQQISLWAGVRRGRGMSDSEINRRFYHKFAVDILSAQSLGRVDAEALATKIEGNMYA